MTDEEKKVLTKLKQIQCSCEGIFYNFEAGAVLNLIEKQQKEIENSVPKEAIREKIEYYKKQNNELDDFTCEIDVLEELLGG